MYNDNSVEDRAIQDLFDELRTNGVYLTPTEEAHIRSQIRASYQHELDRLRTHLVHQGISPSDSELRALYHQTLVRALATERANQRKKDSHSFSSLRSLLLIDLLSLIALYTTTLAAYYWSGLQGIINFHQFSYAWLHNLPFAAPHYLVAGVISLIAFTASLVCGVMIGSDFQMFFAGFPFPHLVIVLVVGSLILPTTALSTSAGWWLLIPLSIMTLFALLVQVSSKSAENMQRYLQSRPKRIR